MVLKELFLTNFRNYSHVSVQFGDHINIIYGNNAQGKTNLLESIYVLGLTKSHRSFSDQNLIQSEKKEAKIKGVILKNNIKIHLELYLNEKIKQFKIDQNKINHTNDYIDQMKLIIFYPEDLELVKGSPAIRRNYLNTQLGQLYPTYYQVLNDYQKLLKMRNDFLKQPHDYDSTYFEILTEYLIDKAVLLYRMRKKFIDRLNDNIGSIYENIMKLSGFHIEFVPSIANLDIQSDLKLQLRNAFKKQKTVEYKLGTTLIGPHRDDFIFYLDKFNIKEFGSQGQQRIAVLSLKLAEIELFKRQCQTSPILLLDDVFSELDDEKKNNLLSYINQDIQTIITTTDLKNIRSDILENACLFNIEQGTIISEEVK